MPAVFGPEQPAGDLSVARSSPRPKPNGHPVVPKIVPVGARDPNRLAAARAQPPAGPAFAGGPYREIEVGIDPHQTFWCYLRPNGVPSFTHRILHELADMQAAIKRMFAAGDGGPPVRHFVVGSRTPAIFSLGGDLAYFAECIRAADRAALKQYARACIEVVYSNATSLDLPIITIALVQGDALGGGFEAVLSCNVVVAEKQARMGLPEILFNLFPGMGAYSLLARKLDAARAERMILSGRVYGAQELFELGVVDVLAEDGEGEEAVRQYIARNMRRHGAHRAICEVRRRISPLVFAELEDVEIWIDTALGLEESDLRKMERLAAAQRRRLAPGAPAVAAIR